MNYTLWCTTKFRYVYILKDLNIYRSLCIHIVCVYIHTHLYIVKDLYFIYNIVIYNEVFVFGLTINKLSYVLRILS